MRRAVLAAVTVLAAGLAVPATAAPATAAPNAPATAAPTTAPVTAAPAAANAPAAAPRPAIVVKVKGTYTRLAKDHVTGDGLVHEYEDVLRVPGKPMKRLRLPPRHGLTPGGAVEVSALGTGDGSALDVTAARQLTPAAATTAGPASVIVILAYWTRPDSMTQATARSRVFGDAHAWYKEVSYGAAGLTGVVTPWLRISPPSTGRCYADSEELLANARARAAALGGGYDPFAYQRTILYFPRCSGGDTNGVAGWAYEPGDVAWQNGYLDRRTIVHEQGHNYGMGHARSLACTSGGTRVTFSKTCVSNVYGDPYDAMGRSSYAAHFSGYRKDRAGWLRGGRKRVLTTSSATFTLPPFERTATAPVVVVAQSPRVDGRSYWLEYRRPVGMDARLPGGATGGVIVHLQEPGRPGWLLDPTPGDKSFTTAVIKPGTTWTAPDYVRVSVGSVSSSGARVTVTGARPAPTAPSAPRSVAATATDGGATVTWTGSASDGRSPITAYDVTLTGSNGEHHEVSTDMTRRHVTVHGLSNGVTFTVRVRARNAVGSSVAGTTYVKPYAMPPSVVLTSPKGGVTVRGRVLVTATVTPNPISNYGVTCAQLLVDDVPRVDSCYVMNGNHRFEWNTGYEPNGPRRLRVVAWDHNGREGTSASVAVTVANAAAQAAWVYPAQDAVFNGDHVPLEVSASVPGDPDAKIGEVAFYQVHNGSRYRIGSLYNEYGLQPPYKLNWYVYYELGSRTVIASVTTTAGTQTWTPERTFTIAHPPPTVRITSPAAGATVSGTTMTVTADAAAASTGASVDRVEFRLNGRTVEDRTAPYEAQLDIAAFTGRHTVSALVYETTGRHAWAADVAVTVANVPPALTITSPGYYAGLGPVVHQLRGTATAGTGGDPPDRVVVRVGSQVVGTVTPDADGQWSVPWDAAGRFGNHYLEAKAYTAAGLVTATGTYFSVVHPRPSLVFESPAWSAVARADTVTEFVMTATPRSDDPTTVKQVCVNVSTVSGCATAGADGKYRVPLDLRLPSAHYDAYPTVEMSDGYRHSMDSRGLYVARPPRPPGVAVTGTPGTLTVSVTAPQNNEPVGITGYAVTIGDRTQTVSSTATFAGLLDGTAYDVSVRSVNAAGPGAATVVTATPGPGTTLSSLAGGQGPVEYGGTVTWTARLTTSTGAVAGAAVALDVCALAAATGCAEAVTGTTADDGTVTLAAPVDAQGRLRLRYAGDAANGAAMVLGSLITPTPKPFLTLPETAAFGTQVAFTASAKPPREGRFYLEHRLVGAATWAQTHLGWGSVGSEATSLTTWLWTSNMGRGTFELRVMFLDYYNGTTSHSDVRTMTVT